MFGFVTIGLLVFSIFQSREIHSFLPGYDYDAPVFGVSTVTSHRSDNNNKVMKEAEVHHQHHHHHRRPRIAILYNFVSKNDQAPKLKSSFFDHLINKACYAKYWGYDWVFDQRWGFPDNIRARNQTDTNRCWLDIGNWHRVPQLIDLMESDRYDWVLWLDVDYVFNDIAIPLESLLKEIDLHGLHNISVILPDDCTPQKKMCFQVMLS